MELCKVCVTFVALNFTIMRDYKKHLTLLPHKWQMVGLVMLAIILVCMVPFFILNKRAEFRDLMTYCWVVGNILLSIALLLTCFSAEKVEDEYIMSARYRSLTIVVFIFFIAEIITQMISGGRLLSNTVFEYIGMTVSEEHYSMIEPNSFRGIIYRIAGMLSNYNYLQVFYIVILKLFVRLGKGNSFESILLPYQYKKPGWIMMTVSLILIPIVVYYLGHVLVYNIGDVMDRVVRESYIKTYMIVSRILVVIPFIGLMLVCMSKEEHEDEFLRHIRVRTLAFFVILFILITFIYRVSWGVEFLISRGRSLAQVPIHLRNTLMHFNRVCLFVTYPPLLALAYALVLRKVLSKNLTESSNEE